MKFKLHLILIAFFCFGSAMGQNTWSKKNSFGGAKRGLANSFVINGTAYVLCGLDGSTYLKDLWEYNAKTDQWTQKASIPGNGRTEAFAFSIDSLGYVGNGLTQTSNPDNKVYCYNPRTDSWKTVANTPYVNGTRIAGSFTIGNKGYIFGGLPTGSAHSKDLYSYDPVKNQWAKETSLPSGNTGRTYTSCASINDMGYMLGGYDGSTYYKHFWQYNSKTNKITKLKDYPGSENIGTSMFVLNDRIYAGSGRTKTAVLDDWYEYLPSKDSWSMIASIPSVHNFAHTSFSINGKGYVVCGTNFNGSSSSNEVYEYSPKTLGIFNTGKSSADIKLFPNPVQSELNIQLPTELSNQTISYHILGMDGKLIKKGNFQSISSIDVSEISIGLYILNIQSRNQNYAIRFSRN